MLPQSRECFSKRKPKERNEGTHSPLSASTKKVIWFTSEKFNKARRSQSKIPQPHCSIKPSDMISYLQTWTSVSFWWGVIHLDHKTIWWTIPLMYWCWQLSHEIVIVGLWASSAAKTMCCHCVLRSPVCTKTETNTSNLAGVCTFITFSHTPPLLYFTHLKYGVSSRTSMHIKTPTYRVCVCVWVCMRTLAQTVSIPPLFFVLAVVYYRSRLRNDVEVAYFLQTSLSLSFF